MVSSPGTHPERLWKRTSLVWNVPASVLLFMAQSHPSLLVSPDTVHPKTGPAKRSWLHSRYQKVLFLGEREHVLCLEMTGRLGHRPEDSVLGSMLYFTSRRTEITSPHKRSWGQTRHQSREQGLGMVVNVCKPNT